ncbi:DUF6220 domain-containing protein [Streptomyces chiangmaiensis]|uniref:DUF6220 domain-containing protein n=1 Tax=Streptomyces chiangmaiensis TaxID=766497 RepID=A0ABU7FT72_9ACTN|nr:DUF6220 domain-containing protein [Streptomyces chiangmaiensis]MED7827325.1 DUF6220 domain-containing protein [Streptomyces chiangmaiensis]
MHKTIAGLAAVLMLAIVVQFFLAGSGAFDTAPNDESFGPHRALGYMIVLLALLTTLTAALARIPGRLVGMTGLLAGLGIAQPVIAIIAKAFGDTGDTTTAGQLVFGLHAVNGLIMMGVAGRILRQARELSNSSASTVRAAVDDARAAGPTPGSAQ